MADGTDHPDWTQWHAEYDLAGSRLERRLSVVRRLLAEALDQAPTGPIRLVSACAGEGRDVLGVLPGHGRSADVTALLVEADPDIAARAAERARASGLGSVGILIGDAGEARSYQSMVPADIALFCGVFGNITAADVARTILELRTLLAPRARVLWTRGRDLADDATPRIRRWFASAGFVEEAFVAPEDEAYQRGQSSFTVGMNRLEAEPLAFDPGSRLFDFIGYRRVRRQEGA